MKEVSVQIVDYIVKLLQRGYQPDQVFDYMKEQGYDEATLLEHFHVVNDRYYSGNLAFDKLHVKQHSSHTALIAVAAFLVIGLIVGGYVLFATQNSFVSLTDVEIVSFDDVYAQGQPIQVEVTLIKQTSDAELVDLTYSIIDRSTQEIIVSRQESRTITESIQYLQSFSELAVGEYTVAIDASSSGSSFFSSSTFTVSEAIALNDQTLLGLMLSQEHPEDGLLYCEQIGDEVLSRECYYYLALQEEFSEACSSLETTLREECYSNLIINGQLEFCEETENERTLELCERITNA